MRAIVGRVLALEAVVVVEHDVDAGIERGDGRRLHRLRGEVDRDARGLGGDRRLDQRHHAGVAGVLRRRLEDHVDAEVLGRPGWRRSAG